MTEATPRPVPRQERQKFGPADFLTLSRIPLAVAFLRVDLPLDRLGILAAAALSDLLDGALARRLGGSRFGAVLDPITDKLFMAAAFLVVLLSGRLAWYEVVAVLLRDLVATGAFVVWAVSGRPAAVPARLGGKAVTLGQVLTLVAFLLDSPLLQELAWATAAIAIYAIYDYARAVPLDRRPLGA
ncbi:MAG TPA: CDP-alcohol phosphatidyltransferase family protein [Gemmatimonadales bacterium]|nr:CDP-alcohol phosphatidyltransferase family protein [Gemmatimonadales bacterium]